MPVASDAQAVRPGAGQRERVAGDAFAGGGQFHQRVGVFFGDPDMAAPVLVDAVGPAVAGEFGDSHDTARRGYAQDAV
ncbi:hypothetical protein XF35_01115 [Streptomyces platensis subsp. clarensis]|nr:hypothetical protein [Streptomyces platensis subsp. clarensis]